MMKEACPILFLLLLPLAAQDAFRPDIPKVWDSDAIATVELPPPIAGLRRIQATPGRYYNIPLRPVLKSYPVYHPDKEPPNYLEWLKQREPEIAFDPAGLRTERDWLRAGEILFDSPLAPNGQITDVRDPAWYATVRVPVAKDGTVPFFRFVVLKKGEIAVGRLACAMCHTRVLPDGTVVKGAQGNFPFDHAQACDFRKHRTLDEIVRLENFLFRVPWLPSDTTSILKSLTLEQIVAAHESIPPGVVYRTGTGLTSPVQIPDLIGVKDRKYLDHTGLQNHRSIGDLMRYAALNSGLSSLTKFTGQDPEPPGDSLSKSRYSDDQLYALALFIYSLQPPPNPNRPDVLTMRGEKIFQREGCAGCHPPPLYTNNRLVPVEGFVPPAQHQKTYDILNVAIGTDPTLAMQTNRATGYYKVPSLKGVWYRSPLEHAGSVATLNDWLDLARLQNNYVPTGFIGYGARTRAVKGHQFGLTLPDGEKRALIAFLKTL